MRNSKFCQIVRRNLMLFVVLLMAIAVNAVPAKPGLKRTLQLVDGTTVEALLVGDEYGHYWRGTDGKAYREDDTTGFFQVVDEQAVKESAKVKRANANTRRMSRLAPRKVGEVGDYTGKKKGLIILVNFSNVSFKTANNNALYKRIANEKDFKYNNFVGSMYDYFYSQSEGQFELTFDVVGPLTVSNTQSYYGSNDSGGNDKHPAEMVIEALKLADSQVNYADYDWDGDKEVDQVYVVYAGKGEADGGASTTIWPHEWQLDAAAYYGDGLGAQNMDGVKIDTYACGSELDGQTGAIAGIGTMCHEFSHCLGYPDFYDTDYSGGQGMGYWDLMDGGSYNGNGFQPSGYTTYERWVAGWKTPIELTKSKSVTNMKALQDGGEGYIIYNGGNRNEYFILENRQKVGWDASLPGAGLLILHVDYNASSWASNTPNDYPSHQRMTWIAADNEYQYTTDDQGTKYYSFDGMATDTYPYGSVNAFNKSTKPAAKFYNRNSDDTYYLDSSVENITQNADGTVSFNFIGINTISIPTFSPVPGVYSEPQSVTINCDTEGASIYYTLDGSTPTANSTQYTTPIQIESTTTIKAIAIADSEESAVATGNYVIRTTAGDVNTFKRVETTSELVSGMRYIIACGSKNTAAGALSNSYLTKQDITIDKDIATINDNVAVFLLEASGSGYLLKNEKSGKYLYATKEKKLAYSDQIQVWTVGNHDSGVTLSSGGYGMMLYNVTYPRFLTYTSSPSSSMIRANLYMEYDAGTVTKQDVTMTFSETECTATMGESFEKPTLTTQPEGIEVSYTSSDEQVATVDGTTGEVTLVGVGTTIITASFAGNDNYNEGSATYTLIVNQGSNPDNPTEGTGRYRLITSADELESGKNYLIVGYYESQDLFAAYNGFNSNKGDAGNVNPEDNVIDLNVQDNNAVPVVLNNLDNDLWSIFDSKLEVYVGASTTRNNLDSSTSQPTSEYYQWSISIDEQGVATVKNSGKGYYMKYNYNNGADLFRAYASGQQDIYLYKEIEKVNVLKGDVNGDGLVNIADVVAIVNYILGTPQEVFHFDAADMDDNEEVNITDAVALVNSLLEAEN